MNKAPGRHAAVPNNVLQVALQDTLIGNHQATYILNMMGNLHALLEFDDMPSQCNQLRNGKNEHC